MSSLEKELQAITKDPDANIEIKHMGGGEIFINYSWGKWGEYTSHYWDTDVPWHHNSELIRQDLKEISLKLKQQGKVSEMKNADTPASPIIIRKSQDRIRQEIAINSAASHSITYAGLTKREYFAGEAMKGIMAQDVEDQWTYDQIASFAVEASNALLKALSED